METERTEQGRDHCADRGGGAGMALRLGRGGSTMHTGEAGILRGEKKLPGGGGKADHQQVPGAERQREELQRVSVLPEQRTGADR